MPHLPRIVPNNTQALQAFKMAIKDRVLDQKDFTNAIKPYAPLLSRPGQYRDTVRGVVSGTTDQFVDMTPGLKTKLEKLMTLSPTVAREAFEGAVANGKLSAKDVKVVLEPYVELLRKPGGYRDAVSALVQGRTDRTVILSSAAKAFFQREGIL